MPELSLVPDPEPVGHRGGDAFDAAGLDATTRASAEPAPAELDALVTAHLPLVGHIAREMVSRLPTHVERADLVSAGSMALVLAARTWDSSRGVPFAGYAAIRVRGALKDELRTMDWASRGVRARGRAVADTRTALQSSLGRTPTDAEVVEATGLSEGEVRASDSDLARASVLSLHAPSAEDGVAALACPRTGPEDVLLERESLGYLEDAVAELPVRLRRVVTGYFFEERPMAELAAELGVTESRISQLRAEAVRLLRAALAEPLHRCAPTTTTSFGPRVVAAQQAYVAAVGSRRSATDRLRATRYAGVPASYPRAVGNG